MPARGPLRPIARRALAAQSDERLVKLIREGHEPAFEEAVRRYRGPLVAFAAAIVSADRAEDVVQSSLMKALDALRRDDREVSLRPWLFAIVRNGALNEIRGEAPVDELREAGALAAGPGEIAERREEMDRLVVAMCALPDAQRQALVKRELEGVGHGEIAAQLGTTATAVRGLIFRARVGLRDALGALLPLPVMRALLAEGTAAGLAGGGAAAGIVGGSAAKGGAAAAAAIVALGTGVAIDRSTRDEPGSQRPEVARAQAPDRPSGQPSATEPGTRPDAATGGGSEGTSGSSGPSATSGDSGNSGPSASSGPGAGGGDEGDDDGGSSSSGPGSDDGDGGEGESPSPPQPSDDGDDDSDDDSDHSGSGGESGSSSTSGSGSSSGSGSGSGSSSGSNSGPGSGAEPEPVEEPEVDDSSGSGGNSGPGGGEVEPPDDDPIDEDHSGSG